MRPVTLLFSALLLLAAACARPRARPEGEANEPPRATPAFAAAPYAATGARVGEVTSTSAVIWTRLTRTPMRVTRGRDFERSASRPWTAERLPVGWRVDELVGACPGAPGEGRVVYRPADTAARADSVWARRPWRRVEAESDFVIQERLDGLRPDSTYRLRVETRASDESSSRVAFEGSFRTAPPANVSADVTFTVVTGMLDRHLDHPDGFEIYRSMAALEPDFLVATGDTVYYDRDSPAATDLALARFHWQRMYSLPRHIEFHRRVPGYWIKDDHDTFQNDCWPGMDAMELVAPFTFAEGQRIFLDEVPLDRARRHPTVRRARWGRLLEIWLLEGRDFRSANDASDGPEKTILGREQLLWLKTTLLESNARFKVLVSATPIVGPDAPGKADNHADEAFRTEGDALRSWFAKYLPQRFYIVCGDRHWQYHSVDPKFGGRLREFSCGPASDVHAHGSPGFDPRYHVFHREGGGFLSVTVRRTASTPRVEFRHHDVDGHVVAIWTEE